ncbi:MAG: MFS transporter [Alphaproteobacteria bacterium]
MAAPGLLRHRNLRLFLASQLSTNLAGQIVTVAVGWQIYDLTRDPLDLGIAGLVEFLPSLLLVLLTGQVADRFDRRSVVIACVIAEVLAVGVLLGYAGTGGRAVWPIFAVLAVLGIARAFWSPAERALLPNLVPRNILSPAIALNTSTWQAATIVGPAMGGLLYGLGAEAVYGAAAALLVAGIVATAMIDRPPRVVGREPSDWQNLIAGFRFVWRERVVLGAISLDLFAVLLGGASALLPVFARDILEVGPWGLGLLRAAPGVGAVLTALYLARRPLVDREGAIMFVCVAGFGLAASVFGLSVTPWLSILALAVMGAADMVSVTVRETLIQLWTPDRLRGRVNAVNMVFVGASNQFGEFRAGVMAALIGAIAAVVVGGAGTVLVAGLWAVVFPELRRVRRLMEWPAAGETGPPRP